MQMNTDFEIKKQEQSPCIPFICVYLWLFLIYKTVSESLVFFIGRNTGFSSVHPVRQLHSYNTQYPCFNKRQHDTPNLSP